MIKYLLDTNIVSDLIRHPQGQAAQRIAEVGESAVGTSIVVACELRYGATKKASSRLTQQLEVVLSALPILPYEAPADRFYGSVRVALEEVGKPIGGNDLLLAAQALALGCTLVSDNVREFKRVAGLPVENWLR